MLFFFPENRPEAPKAFFIKEMFQYPHNTDKPGNNGCRGSSEYPQSKWKIKIGARMMLQTTVTMEVNIAFLGYPVARMILFNPIIV